jgi:hypothetical protein
MTLPTHLGGFQIEVVRAWMLPGLRYTTESPNNSAVTPISHMLIMVNPTHSERFSATYSTFIKTKYHGQRWGSTFTLYISV